MTQDLIETEAAIDRERHHNMRQLLLRASRMVNRDIVHGLHAKGYAALRSTHTALLSNIAMTGSTVTDAAARAGITKQAMGRLAADLEAADYIEVRADPDDARARVLHLTETGRRLMMDSFGVMAGLEERYAKQFGKDRFADLMESLRVFSQAEKD